MSDAEEIQAVSGIGRSHANIANSRLAARATDPVLILTASEIGSFAFCPAAWHLERCGAARNSASVLNLEHGTLTHRRIATHATRVRTLQRVRRLMLVLIVALLAGAMLQILSAGGLPRP